MKGDHVGELLVGNPEALRLGAEGGLRRARSRAASRSAAAEVSVLPDGSGERAGVLREGSLVLGRAVIET